MVGSVTQQRRAKFWNKSTSLDIDAVEASSVDPTRNSFSPRSSSPISLVCAVLSNYVRNNNFFNNLSYHCSKYQEGTVTIYYICIRIDCAISVCPRTTFDYICNFFKLKLSKLYQKHLYWYLQPLQPVQSFQPGHFQWVEKNPQASGTNDQSGCQGCVGFPTCSLLNPSHRS